MDLSELPPFEELVKGYDLDFCEEMVRSIKVDITNLENASVTLMERSAKMRGLTIEEHLTEQRAVLEERLQLVNDRIKELS